MKRPVYRVQVLTRPVMGERFVIWWGEDSATMRASSGLAESLLEARWETVDLPLWYRWANVWKVEAKITEVTGYRRR